MDPSQRACSDCSHCSHRRVWIERLGLFVLIAELVGVGAWLVWQWSGRAPPEFDGTFVDAQTQAELRNQSASCRKAADWAQLASHFLASGYFPQAEVCFRQARQREPGQADFALWHAFALERLGEIEAALEVYGQALHWGHPRRADVHYYIGKNFLRLEQPEAARRAFVEADDLPAARYELAMLAAREGRAEEARRLAAQLAQEFPTTYPPAGLLHRLAVLQGDAVTAAYWADQFNYRPRPLPSPFDQEADWIFRLANSLGRDRLFRDAGRHYQAGEWEQAERLLRQAQQLVWTPEVADRLADVLFVQGRYAAAAELLREILERDGPSWELLWRLGQAQASLGRTAEAGQLWQRAQRWATGPLAAELYQDLSQWYQAQGQMQQAQWFRGRAHLTRGIHLLDQGQTATALSELEQAVRQVPELADAWFFLGETYRQTGRPAEAQQAYQQCLRYRPHHGRAADALKSP
ncbi:MAG: tetratricopeptide repeat protein [Gemmataceae bacterium]|nr:tetratricopeptide repeat protein [Gemmataceae bacterium]MCS7269767.1 tetratricopeptide repeat protein [Gemmataceae bacterium]MDW8243588.1 tetratricopeptide repeat protein [Thermogemmata sp.]